MPDDGMDAADVTPMDCGIAAIQPRSSNGSRHRRRLQAGASAGSPVDTSAVQRPRQWWQREPAAPAANSRSRTRAVPHCPRPSCPGAGSPAGDPGEEVGKSMTFVVDSARSLERMIGPNTDDQGRDTCRDHQGDCDNLCPKSPQLPQQLEVKHAHAGHQLTADGDSRVAFCSMDAIRPLAKLTTRCAIPRMTTL